MRVKFNKFERIAGMFVGVAIAGFLVATLTVAVKKGWFDSKVSFTTTMVTADGVHPGTMVQISGLRAGSVDDVELVSATEVKVRFGVLERFASKIKQDSVVQLIRPFIIGEKVLEVTVGATEQPALEAHAEIPMRDTFDVMDLLGGRKMSAFVTSFDHMADSLRIFAEAFSDPQRSKAIVSMVDQLAPLAKNLNYLSNNVNKITDTALKEHRLELMMINLAKMSEELGQILPEFSREVPDMGHQMAQIIQNLNTLTTEFAKLTPAINAIAPDLPRTTKRAVEALDETVVLLKAMQRSWLLRSNVKDIKEEESKKDNREESREPASK